jgi:hypothetical protein
MLRCITRLPIRRLAVTLGTLVVLGLAAGWLPGSPGAVTLAQVDTTPTLCGDSFGGNCSWS